MYELHVTHETSAGTEWTAVSYHVSQNQAIDAGLEVAAISNTYVNHRVFPSENPTSPLCDSCATAVANGDHSHHDDLCDCHPDESNLCALLRAWYAVPADAIVHSPSPSGPAYGYETCDVCGYPTLDGNRIHYPTPRD